MIVELLIGQSKIDLFKDEDISLKESILNISDISKNTTAFTKTFSVPASDNNNMVFKHYYNTNIDGGFDARTKVDGSIKLDGFTFKFGNLRLSEVNLKSGVPSTYRLVFWGKLTDLKKLFGKEKLKDLDLSFYDFQANNNNVLNKLQNGNQSIIYNLFVKKQLFYDSDPGDNTNTAQISNIADNGTSSSVSVNELLPSIKLIRLIEAIEEKYSIKFTRQFFDRTEFLDLYLLLDSEKDENASVFIQEINFDGGETFFMNQSTNTATFNFINSGLFPNQTTRSFNHKLTLTPNASASQTEYTLKTYLNGVLFRSEKRTGFFESESNSFDFVQSPTQSETYTLRFEVEASGGFQYSADLETEEIINGVPTQPVNATASEASILRQFVISQNVPDITIIDFMKGLFNAFKLVVITQEDGDIYVNDVNSYYDSGELLDVTKYIDFKNVKVSRGELFNEINFNFEEGETILQNQFKQNTGLFYGDEDTIIRNEDGDLIDGTSQKIKLPFEQIIYERLNDVNDNLQTNIQYASLIDLDRNKTSVKAHIFYNVNTSVGDKQIAVERTDGTIFNNFTNINTPSHTNTLQNETFAFLFSQEFSTWSGLKTSKNLYTNYHKNYIDNTFNVKRRNFFFDAVLPSNIIYKLTLNDVLKIGKNYYRILDYSFSLLDGKTKFKLINSFEPNLRKLTPNNTVFFLNKEAQSFTTYVVNGNTKVLTFDYIDTGFGTNFVTTVQDGDLIINTITENNTGGERTIIISVKENGVEIFQIFVTQEHGILVDVNFDSTIITFDNNNITFDNNN
jgi:hypothetical protein